jgi:hypothetical protein
MARQTDGFNNSRLAEVIDETRRLIADMDQRIARQQKRVEKILINREGEAAEMQALLADMIEARSLMQAQLDSFKDEEKANGNSGTETSQRSTEA